MQKSYTRTTKVGLKTNKFHILTVIKTETYIQIAFVGFKNLEKFYVFRLRVARSSFIVKIAAKIVAIKILCMTCKICARP